MSSCNHTALVQLCGDQNGCAIIDTYRFDTITRFLPRPHSQQPAIVTFVGQKVKQEALRHLYPWNNSKESRTGGMLRLRLDNASSNLDHPILYVDTDLTFHAPASQQALNCHQQRLLPVSWQSTSLETVFDHVFTRVVIATSNLVVLFANDFATLDDLTRTVTRWVEVGLRLDLPPTLRPRLLIVVRGDAYDSEDIRLLYDDIQQSSRSRITHLFSQVTTVYLRSTELSALAAFRPLREEIMRQVDESLELLSHGGWLFSANHLAALTRIRLEHVASTEIESMNVFLSTRRPRCSSKTLVDHFEVLASVAERRGIPYESVTSYLATAILMDAYPNASHRFDPTYAFRSHYEHACYCAFERTYGTAKLATFLTSETERHLRYHYEYLRAGQASAAELHATNLITKLSTFAGVKTNATCLLCLVRMPQHTLSCGHSICDICTGYFGRFVTGLEYHFQVKKCALCLTTNQHPIRVKPPTCGTRILSLDGGGTRGVIQLQYMRMLQDAVGAECRIQDLFDVAVGTSAGALIALIMFAYSWSPNKAIEKFESIARRLFRNAASTGDHFLARLRSTLSCWLNDGRYDEESVVACLKETFGETQCLFGSGQCGIKLAIPATSISDAGAFLFTTYNVDAPRRDKAYTVLPHGALDTEAPVWQVARATSAAPMFFPPAKVQAHGTFQDGALRFNNPINIGVWESRNIWPTTAKPDVALSLGTGTTELQSPKAPGFRHVLVDGFFLRCCRSFLSSLDGEAAWREFLSGMDDNTRDRYFRLNVFLERMPEIDDVECMQRVRNAARLQPNTITSPDGVLNALLTASFFFELDRLPSFQAGVLHCEGTVYCRNRIYAILQGFAGIGQRPADFANEDGYLADFGGIQSVCPYCHQYRKKVAFVIRDTRDPITLYLRMQDSTRRRLSGFPRDVQWFIDQQGLAQPFARSALQRNPSCKHCSGAKRFATADSERQYPAMIYVAGMADLSRNASILTTFPTSEQYESIISTPSNGPTKRKPEESQDSGKYVRRRFERSQIRPLKLPVNSSSLFEPHSRQLVPSNVPDVSRAQLRARPGTSSQDQTWHSARAILETEQAGACTISHLANADFDVVAIKKRKATERQAQAIRPTAHQNLINIRHVYDQDGAVSVFYEYHYGVSLADIEASPCQSLAEFELAALCNEILHGLQYIHGELGVGYKIAADSIILSLDGRVMLGDVDTHLLDKTPTHQSDVADVGVLIAGLSRPERQAMWSHELSDFIQSAEHRDCDALLLHDFLKVSPGPGCLRPHVLITLFSTLRLWKLAKDDR